MQRLVYAEADQDMEMETGKIGKIILGLCKLQCRGRQHNQSSEELQRRAALGGYQYLSVPNHWPTFDRDDNIRYPDKEMVQGDNGCYFG